jgi:YVTN family beta-propeller protein
MRSRLVPLLLLASGACATLRGAGTPMPPLGEGAELHVYLQRLPQDAERLSFEIQSVTLRRADGTEAPLAVQTPKIDGAEGGNQRHLAWGRVAPGEYTGITVTLASAALGEGTDRSRLLTEPEPVTAELHLRLAPGRSTVVWLALAPGAVQGEFAFAPRFGAVVPTRIAARASLFCSNAGAANVTVADRSARVVTDVIPVPGTPRGIVIDALATRGYVALHLEDRIEVLDLAAGVPIAEIRMLPGDGPGDLGIAADGTLVVVNVRSRTVAFVDPSSFVELGRVPVGDDPFSLLVDRQGRRAFVANRASNSVTAIDLGNRVVLGTIGTDPEPLRMTLSFDGSLLYVVCRGSQDVTSFAIPTLAPAARTFVGLGAVSVKVDPRSGLVYLSRGEERTVAVLDPLSLQQIDVIDVPAAVSIMTIDDAENTLLALLPARQTIFVVDLTSRKTRAEIPVGVAPYALAFVGERL